MHAARRTASLTVYLTPETDAALRACAERDDRTISSAAARILRDALAPFTSESPAGQQGSRSDSGAGSAGNVCIPA